MPARNRWTAHMRTGVLAAGAALAGLIPASAALAHTRHHSPKSRAAVTHSPDASPTKSCVVVGPNGVERSSLPPGAKVYEETLPNGGKAVRVSATGSPPAGAPEGEMREPHEAGGSTSPGIEQSGGQGQTLKSSGEGGPPPPPPGSC